MKVRNGFVSNSSSSSFVILGYSFDSIEDLLSAIMVNKEIFSKACKSIYDNLHEYYDYDGEYTEDITNIIDVLKENDVDIYDLMDDINGILKFNFCQVNRNDYGDEQHIYIGNSMNFIGNYAAVLNRIEETRKEMEKLGYYNDETLSIYAMFCGRDDEGNYQSI